MYLDKPMKDHTLLQAICRTNRTYDQGKTHGLIVDYIGIFDDVAKALDFDENSMRRIITNIEEIKKQLPALLKKCLSYFMGIDRTVEGWEGLMAAQECLPTNKEKDAFAADYRVLNRAWDALSPDSFLNPYKVDYQWLSRVYESVKPTDGRGGLIWASLGAKTIELVHQNVTVGEAVFNLGGVLFNGDFYNINRVVWNAKRTNSMTYSGQQNAACYECTASTFVFGDSVVNIPAFFGYESNWAKSITIGKSVEWIGEYAFYKCSKLRTIKCFALVPPKFPDSYYNFKYYKTAEVWKNFTILPLGDMTGDSVVDVDDLSAIIDMLLHKANSKDAADLNSDGVVDIDDIGLLINFMIGK